MYGKKISILLNRPSIVRCKTSKNNKKVSKLFFSQTSVKKNIIESSMMFWNVYFYFSM
jgi:hypothetical protein